MVISNSQFYVFIFYMYIGAILSVVYFLLHFFLYMKSYRKEKLTFWQKAVRIIADVAFVIIAGVVVIYSKVYLVNAQFRLYSLVAIIVGAYISYKVIKNLLEKMAIKLLDKANNSDV